MTSDDQHFLDVLSGISKDIAKFSADVAEATDRHFESVASSIRKTLASSTWLPKAARPPPPPPPVVRAPLGYLQHAQAWVSRNRAWTAAIVAFLGTGTFLLYRRRKVYGKKRRARRASNGARKEVVVIAGPPNSPITRSLALDLERRGFIVYVVVNTVEEEQMVHNESRADIKPLHLDITDPLNIHDAMERFSDLLHLPHRAFAGASPHELTFTGLILAPDLMFPSGPVDAVSPDLWSDALNAKVLGTIVMIQAFLPAICDSKARVLVLTPSIVSALRPPFHGVESTVVGALEGFTASLRRELGTLGIDVCHFRLGTLDVGGKQHLQSTNATKTYAWPSSVRTHYTQNSVSQSRVAGSKGLFSENGSAAKGSPMRELHNAVFDALTQRRPKKVWRVGKGSLTYDMIGSWAPAGLVGWMLGVRRVGLEEEMQPRLEDSVSWEKVEQAV